jgi:hypothetical protein
MFQLNVVFANLDSKYQLLRSTSSITKISQVVDRASRRWAPFQLPLGLVLGRSSGQKRELIRCLES